MEIEHNLEAFIKALESMPKQISYADRLARNRVGEKVRQFWFSEQLPNKATIRNQWSKPGFKLGMNLQQANSSKPDTIVYTRAPWAEQQEVGGLKTPKKSNLIIPVLGGARPSITAVVDSDLKPRKGGGVFIETINKRGGGKFTGAFMQVGNHLKLMFTLIKKAVVKPRFDLIGSGEKKAESLIEPEYTKALEDAFRTAKLPK